MYINDEHSSGIQLHGQTSEDILSTFVKYQLQVTFVNILVECDTVNA
jgi:hypothetical protein